MNDTQNSFTVDSSERKHSVISLFIYYLITLVLYEWP